MSNRLKNKQLLINNAAVTGSATILQQGGLYSFNVVGTFGGTTVKLQILGPDDATYVDVPTASFTAAGVIGVYLPAGGTVKAVVTGGAPANLYASLALVD